MGALRFATGRTVTVANGMTGNAGTSTYAFRIKSGPAGITLPASGLAGFLGVSGASTSNGPVTNSSGQIRVYQAGTNRYGSTAQLIFDGVPFDYTLTHNSGGSWDIYDNLAASPTGESGTFSTSTAWTGGTALNQFGRSSNSNATYLTGDIEFIEVTGLANAEKWDANLSGGTGTTLPTTSGNNQGTLNGFSGVDADNWIGFGSDTTLESNSRSTSNSTSQLQTAITFASVSYSTSQTLSDLVAGSINFASEARSASRAQSAFFTQITFASVARSTSNSQSDLQVGAPSTITLESNSRSTSAAISALSTSITFASVSNSESRSASDLSFKQVPVEILKTGKYVERFDGLNFNDHDLKRFDSLAFNKHPLLRWNGTQWAEYNG